MSNSSVDSIVKEAMYGLGDLMNAPTNPTNNNGPLVSGYERNPNNVTIGQRQEIKNLEKYNKRFRDPGPLDRFQLIAKERLLNKQDTFLSIPPSRGKTTPIIGGMRILIKRYLLNRLRYAPVLLYIVPRKQLAGQITSKDVFEDIVLPLVLPLNSGIYTPMPEEKDENLETSHLFNNIIRNDETHLYPDARKLAEFLTAEITGGNNPGIQFNDVNLPKSFPIKPIIVATYEKGVGLISNKISHIVIDEVQELVPHPGESYVSTDLYNRTKTEEDNSIGRYESLANILKTASISTSITLMTGSINNISIKQISEYFNKHYARQFKIVPEFDPALVALNRSTLSVQPLQSISGHTERAIHSRISLCKKIIVAEQNNSLMIVFSKSPIGQGIFRIIQEIIKSIPPKNPNYVKNISGEGLIDIKPKQLNRSINEFEYLKYFDIQDMYKKGPDSKNSVTTPDENNILYQGVLRGIAPLIGSMDQDHKKTVQKLFIGHKLQMLLATDAVGVGANVKVRYLYIPTITKFSNGRLMKTDESSLTQLVHRAGRGGDFTIATIYCSVEDFEYINHLIFNDPRSAVSQINPYLLQDLQTLEKENGAGFVKKLLAKTIFKK